jgi:hypothetical protein
MDSLGSNGLTIAANGLMLPASLGKLDGTYLKT